MHACTCGGEAPHASPVYNIAPPAPELCSTLHVECMHLEIPSDAAPPFSPPVLNYALGIFSRAAVAPHTFSVIARPVQSTAYCKAKNVHDLRVGALYVGTDLCYYSTR